MSLTLFNTKEDLGKLEKFKLLPYELQDTISKYTEEGYNNKCFNYDWYYIIETINFNFGWEYLFLFINEHLTDKKIEPLQIFDCKNMIGYSHNCRKFITNICHKI